MRDSEGKSYLFSLQVIRDGGLKSVSAPTNSNPKAVFVTICAGCLFSSHISHVLFNPCVLSNLRGNDGSCLKNNSLHLLRLCGKINVPIQSILFQHLETYNSSISFSTRVPGPWELVRSSTWASMRTSHHSQERNSNEPKQKIT